MNRLYITLLGLSIAPVLLHANDNPDHWYRGTVYLKSGEDLDAMLQHNPQKDYLLIREKSGIKVYNAGQIDSYEIFDPVSRSYRAFYPLPFSGDRRKGYQFFELLQEGELMLLCRETERRQDQFTPHPFQAGLIYRPYAQIIKVDEFYVLDQEKRIHWFNGSKKQLLTLMADQAENIEALMKSKNFDLRDKMHLKAIFRYYNTLLHPEEKKHPAAESPGWSTYFPDWP